MLQKLSIYIEDFFFLSVWVTNLNVQPETIKFASDQCVKHQTSYLIYLYLKYVVDNNAKDISFDGLDVTVDYSCDFCSKQRNDIGFN